MNPFIVYDDTIPRIHITIKIKLTVHNICFPLLLCLNTHYAALNAHAVHNCTSFINLRPRTFYEDWPRNIGHSPQAMDAKKIKDTRQRLTTEREKLVKSINRTRAATVEIKIEKTEDEGDLATISHDTAVLNNLHEGAFVRLRFIDQAVKALDRGQYGECGSCGEDINEKRLQAVPWATLCIQCQEKMEADRASSRATTPGSDDDMEL
jgi:DnaK suppressor protein